MKEQSQTACDYNLSCRLCQTHIYTCQIRLVLQSAKIITAAVKAARPFTLLDW